MTTLFLIAVAGMALMACVGFYVGKTMQEKQIGEIKDAYTRQMAEMKEAFSRQLAQQKESY